MLLGLLLLASGCAQSAPGAPRLAAPAFGQVDIIPEEHADCSDVPGAGGVTAYGEHVRTACPEEAFENAEIVAIVEVEEVLAQRNWRFVSDPARPDSPFSNHRSIYRPVVLRIIELFKGDDEDLAGLVVLQPGGCDRRDAFMTAVSPSIVYGQPGDRGLVFAASPYDFEELPPARDMDLQTIAEERSEPSAPYRHVDAWPWIRDAGGWAEAAVYWPGAAPEFDQLVAPLRHRQYVRESIGWQLPCRGIASCDEFGSDPDPEWIRDLVEKQLTVFREPPGTPSDAQLDAARAVAREQLDAWLADDGRFCGLVDDPGGWR